MFDHRSDHDAGGLGQFRLDPHVERLRAAQLLRAIASNAHAEDRRAASIDRNLDFVNWRIGERASDERIRR